MARNEAADAAQVQAEERRERVAESVAEVVAEVAAPTPPEAPRAVGPQDSPEPQAAGETPAVVSPTIPIDPIPTIDGDPGTEISGATLLAMVQAASQVTPVAAHTEE